MPAQFASAGDHCRMKKGSRSLRRFLPILPHNNAEVLSGDNEKKETRTGLGLERRAHARALKVRTRDSCAKKRDDAS